MAVPTLITAVLLIAVGAMGYASQDPEKASITALIPAFLGGALAICGLLAFKDGARKHAMHAAAALALLGGLGAPYPIVKRLIKGTDVSFSEPAVISAALTSLICFVFVGLCVRSFIQAKKARQAAVV